MKIIIKLIFFIFLIFLGTFVYIRYFASSLIKKVELVSISPSPAPTVAIQPLTLEKIFFGDKKYLKNLPPEKLITLVSTGDIIPARMVNVKSGKYSDFTWAFKNVASDLKNADLTVGNLEAPLMKDCVATGEGMIFCGSNRHVEGLKAAGIDLVTLANNHSDNFGKEGIEETTKLLLNNNIDYTGLGETKYKIVKNIKFAFLGWNFLLEPNENDVARQIAEAKNNADIVIVFPHWGEEYQEVQTAFQKNMQKIMLEAGADLILGNHPHIIQPMQIDDNTLTIFAHGNFIFDQMWADYTRRGFFAKIYIYDGRLIDAEIFPIVIEDFGQPKLAIAEEKNKMLKDLFKLSVAQKNLPL